MLHKSQTYTSIRQSIWLSRQLTTSLLIEAAVPSSQTPNNSQMTTSDLNSPISEIALSPQDRMWSDTSILPILRLLPLHDNKEDDLVEWWKGSTDCNTQIEETAIPLDNLDLRTSKCYRMQFTLPLRWQVPLLWVLLANPSQILYYVQYTSSSRTNATTLLQQDLGSCKTSSERVS